MRQKTLTVNTIRLDAVLPKVFGGMEDDERVRSSRIWMADCRFERGGHYLVEAESGMGKSSMCSYIYGARTDYSGTILFDGSDVRAYSDVTWCALRQSVLALVPQHLALFGGLTAIENVMLKNDLTGHRTKGEIEAMFERLGIADRMNRRVDRLSVGQQQRVAIIRALCQPFDFLLLDEPVSHLDSENNRRVAALVSEAAAESGGAVISTSVGNPLLLDNAIHLKL